MKRIYVFDNGGETFDRYTILDTKTGDCYGSSSNPFHAQGFGQYAGNIVDNHYRITFGYGWRKGHTPKGIRKLELAAIEDYIEQAKADPKWIGEIVPTVYALPKEVRQYIHQIKN
jgi:hypothetical protein